MARQGLWASYNRAALLSLFIKYTKSFVSTFEAGFFPPKIGWQSKSSKNQCWNWALWKTVEISPIHSFISCGFSFANSHEITIFLKNLSFYIPAFNFREHLMQSDGFGVFWKFLKSTLLDASRGERQVYKFDFAALWDNLKAFSSSKIKWKTYLVFDIWTRDPITMLKHSW